MHAIHNLTKIIIMFKHFRIQKIKNLSIGVKSSISQPFTLTNVM